MQASTQTNTVVTRASLARLVGQVLWPGPLRGRAVAAAGLPAWLTVVLGAVSLLLAAEIIGYVSAVTHHFLQTMFARWEDIARIPTGAAGVFLEVAIQQIRPHVIPAILGKTAHLLTGASVLTCLAILLESLNLVLLAPRALGCGQKIRRVLRKTRKVLLALGGIWMLEWSIAGLALFLMASALVLRIIEVMYIRISYTLLDDLTTLSLEVCLAGLLLAWILRLMRAAGSLAPASIGPLPERCSCCGYLLEGVPTGGACRECGQADPAEPDRQRRNSPWLQRHTCGWYRALAATSAAMLGHPASFFAGLRTLSEAREGLRLLGWNLGLSLGAWLLAVPGIATAMTEPDDIYIAGRIGSAILIALLVGAGLALAAALLIGLLSSLMGFSINRVREEAAWPIAVNSGCYLSAILPRVSAIQALWVTGLFTAEQAIERGLWVRLARHLWIATGVPWEILLSAVFALPLLAGLVWLAWTTIVCYRNVRYACR